VPPRCRHDVFCEINRAFPALTSGAENGIVCGLEFKRYFFGSKTLANSAQAKKRAKQAEGRRQQNTSARATMRTAMKKVIAATATGDKTAAQEALKAAVPVIDKTCGKGLLAKNTAARYKSRLNARVRALA
jgi:small subunit ribosomal protein S20